MIDVAINKFIKSLLNKLDELKEKNTTWRVFDLESIIIGHNLVDIVRNSAVVMLCYGKIVSVFGIPIYINTDLKKSYFSIRCFERSHTKKVNIINRLEEIKI